MTISQLFWMILVPATTGFSSFHQQRRRHEIQPTSSSTTLWTAKKNDNDGPIEWSDFEGYNIGGDDDIIAAAVEPRKRMVMDSGDTVSSPDAALESLVQKQMQDDPTGIQTRQFSLGPDFLLDRFIGKMGFDEVTDWEYYYPEEQEDGGNSMERRRVEPNPLDPSQPKRTRTSSGSVVRLFRGELVGSLGGTIRAQGGDNRILVKEFSGKLALQLASVELETIAKLQSNLVSNSNKRKESSSSSRTGSSSRPGFRQDTAQVVQLLQLLREDAPFLGILGQVNLAELDDDPNLANDFYRALSVPPPPDGAVWIVYEYAGLTTLQELAQPAVVRRANVPLRKGFFGTVLEPPSLPAWSERARYLQEIMKRSIEAVAALHESGMVHGSIGRASLVVSSTRMDKREASSVYATLGTMGSALRIKLADYGFSKSLYDNPADMDSDLMIRARSFGLTEQTIKDGITRANFCIAEDMHALGFCFLGLLLSSLAELPTATTRMPACDEDTLQRLFTNIFDKDVQQFREYVSQEDEIWSNLVEFLDDKEGAGWTVLETLLLAREKVSQTTNEQIFSIRGLLSNPFFS